MHMTDYYINQLVEKSIARHNREISIRITDGMGVIILDTSGPVGGVSSTSKYVIDSKHSTFVSVDTNANADFSMGGHMRYFQPIINFGEVKYVVSVMGRVEVIQTCCDALKDSIESFLAYNAQYSSLQTRIVHDLVFGSANHDFVIKNLDETMFLNKYVFAVILIDIDKASYAQISEELGDQMGNISKTVSEVISKNQYIVKNDLHSFVDENQVVILKTLPQLHDSSRSFMTLDKICKSLLEDLESIPNLNTYISYGNVFDDLFDAPGSYKDAWEIMEMNALIKNATGHFYSLEDIFFESVCSTLHPQIVNKFILPYLERITDENGKVNVELLHIAEQYVFNCMHMGHTAQALYLHRNTVDNKLERFMKITGLRPDKIYRDTFIIKMMDKYIKMGKYRP